MRITKKVWQRKIEDDNHENNISKNLEKGENINSNQSIKKKHLENEMQRVPNNNFHNTKYMQMNTNKHTPTKDMQSRLNINLNKKNTETLTNLKNKDKIKIDDYLSNMQSKDETLKIHAHKGNIHHHF